MSLRSAKYVAAAACCIMFVLQIISMSGWPNLRGIIDDLCYLRQAHLFQTLGIDGLNTDLALDSADRYFANLIEPLYPTSAAPTLCHNLQPATAKHIIQYPPGTGFVLSLFKEGSQAKHMFMAMTAMVLLFAFAAISKAKNKADVIASSVFGFVAIYLMINPVKSSYSAAPSVAVCALIGFVTPYLILAKQRAVQIAVVLLLGVLVGSLTNFRLPNILLAAGYLTVFAITFLVRRDLKSFLDGGIFGAGFLLGILPTLAAQAINAGSPFRTTYSSIDTLPPEFTLQTALYYLTDTQGILTQIAIAWTAFVLVKSRYAAQRQVAWLIAINLTVGVVFFLSHPLLTPYYLIPTAALALWTLLFLHLAFSTRSPEAPST